MALAPERKMEHKIRRGAALWIGHVLRLFAGQLPKTSQHEPLDDTGMVSTSCRYGIPDACARGDGRQSRGQEVGLLKGFRATLLDTSSRTGCCSPWRIVRSADELLAAFSDSASGARLVSDTCCTCRNDAARPASSSHL